MKMGAMTIDEAIRRLVDMGRRMKLKTEGDIRNLLALEMAADTLRRTNRKERMDEKPVAEQKGANSDMRKENIKDITISDLEIMTEFVQKKNVEIEMTITPDQQQMIVRPWKPTKMITSYETEEDS